MVKKIIAVIIIASIVIGTYLFISNYFSNKNAWKIEITQEGVNIRELHTATSNRLGGANVGTIYEVLETYEEDQKFMWFKVEYENGKQGWIASSRQVPYIKEYNNPDGEKNDEPVIMDYARPIIRYFEDVYAVYDINSINYEHLEIEEDSDYEISHKVYFEQFPEDSDIPQYWIEYTVIDEFDNMESKVQKITFEITPDISEVLLFEDM